MHPDLANFGLKVIADLNDAVSTIPEDERFIRRLEFLSTLLGTLVCTLDDPAHRALVLEAVFKDIANMVASMPTIPASTEVH
jgi:hypothetical protein